MNITLASSSAYRQSILAKLNIPFDSLSPDIDESAIKNEHVSQQVERLAQAKAQAVSQHRPNNYVIGSDQLAYFDGQTLGKPGNFVNAKQQLSLLAGNRVQFYTGLSVSYQQQTVSLVEVTEVAFRPLTESQITQYLKLDQPYDCAGSFKSEGLGIALFDRINGRDPNSLIGLPLIGLVDLFAQLNIDLFEYMHPLS
jgi:MAF protein